MQLYILLQQLKLAFYPTFPLPSSLESAHGNLLIKMNCDVLKMGVWEKGRELFFFFFLNKSVLWVKQRPRRCKLNNECSDLNGVAAPINQKTFPVKQRKWQECGRLMSARRSCSALPLICFHPVLVCVGIVALGHYTADRVKRREEVSVTMQSCKPILWRLSWGSCYPVTLYLLSSRQTTAPRPLISLIFAICKFVFEFKVQLESRKLRARPLKSGVINT